MAHPTPRRRSATGMPRGRWSATASNGPTRRDAPRPATECSAEHRLGDRRELHVRRPFVDRPDLRVAIELLDRVLRRIPVAAEKLHAERRHPLADLRGKELRHSAFARDILTRVLE